MTKPSQQYSQYFTPISIYIMCEPCGKLSYIAACFHIISFMTQHVRSINGQQSLCQGVYHQDIHALIIPTMRPNDNVSCSVSSDLFKAILRAREVRTLNTSYCFSLIKKSPGDVARVIPPPHVKCVPLISIRLSNRYSLMQRY